MVCTIHILNLLQTLELDTGKYDFKMISEIDC